MGWDVDSTAELFFVNPPQAHLKMLINFPEFGSQKQAPTDQYFHILPPRFHSQCPGV